MRGHQLSACDKDTVVAAMGGGSEARCTHLSDTHGSCVTPGVTPFPAKILRKSSWTTQSLKQTFFGIEPGRLHIHVIVLKGRLWPGVAQTRGAMSAPAAALPRPAGESSGVVVAVRCRPFNRRVSEVDGVWFLTCVCVCEQRVVRACVAVKCAMQTRRLGVGRQRC